MQDSYTYTVTMGWILVGYISILSSTGVCRPPNMHVRIDIYVNVKFHEYECLTREAKEIRYLLLGAHTESLRGGRLKVVWILYMRTTFRLSDEFLGELTDADVSQCTLTLTLLPIRHNGSHQKHFDIIKCAAATKIGSLKSFNSLFLFFEINIFCIRGVTFVWINCYFNTTYERKWAAPRIESNDR